MGANGNKILLTPKQIYDKFEKYLIDNPIPLKSGFRQYLGLCPETVVAWSNGDPRKAALKRCEWRESTILMQEFMRIDPKKAIPYYLDRAFKKEFNTILDVQKEAIEQIAKKLVEINLNKDDNIC